jgi:hypothetical protein
MIRASMFCEISRIVSILYPVPHKRLNALVVAMIRAEEPEIPAPAGASEFVVTFSPVAGVKNFRISATRPSLCFFADRRASSDG